MTQTILSSATGLLTFGTACVCGIVRNRKREEGKNGFMRYGFPVLCAFLLLCAFTVAGSIVLPGEGPVRRAEEIAALAAVFFCAVTDLYDRIIPNAAVLAVFGGSLACAAVQFLTGEAEGLRFWTDRILGAVLAFAVMGISVLFMKGGIGGGDFKLLSALGFVYGAMGIAELMFFSFLPCALFCVGLLVCRRGTKKTTVPLGPFLALGTAVYTLLCWL